MKKSTILLLIFLLLINSCVENEMQLEINDIVGTWFYVDKDQPYTEAYLDTSEILFYSNEDGWSGPFSYQFQNNILIFHNIQYKVEKINCNMLYFSNPDFNIKLTKIDCITNKKNTSGVNPYHLRRCNYLINNGIITMTDAIEYLNSIEISTVDEYSEKK